MVSVGSDAGKMVRTRITRRSMAQIGRSALQRRQFERPEREVEDSDEEKGKEWNMYDDEESSSESEASGPVQSYADVIFYGPKVVFS